jgi:hypothetical protein
LVHGLGRIVILHICTELAKGMTKQRIVIENEEILLRMLSDLLNVNQERLQVEKDRRDIYIELIQSMRELSESTQEIANRMPYFE